jgi:hypothetical protein
MKKYSELCKVIKEHQYHNLTFDNYLSCKDLPQKFIIIRHDIDRKPLNALTVANIESEHGIKSTYYFRYTKSVFKPDIIKKIADMGHDIGYHYEVLSKTRGDYKKAIDLFEDELTKFREICSTKTICMHGRPLSRYDNKDLWKHYDFKNYGILGEGYLSAGKELNYFSDTGRNWNWNNKLRDFLVNNKPNTFINSTDDLIMLIREGKIDKFYILVHPERWSKNGIEWSSVYIQDSLFNYGKKILSAVR